MVGQVYDHQPELPVSALGLDIRGKEDGRTSVAAFTGPATEGHRGS